MPKTLEDLAARLFEMGSSEATSVGEVLESIWWDEKDDEKAKALALESLKSFQAWAKKAEEVLSGVRTEL